MPTLTMVDIMKSQKGNTKKKGRTRAETWVVVRMIDGNGVSDQARSYVQLIGWQNTWEQAPGVPATPSPP